MYTSKPPSARRGRVSRQRIRQFSASLLIASGLAGCGSSDDAVAVAAPALKTPSEQCLLLKGRVLGRGEASIVNASIEAAAGAAPEYCLVQAKFADSELAFETRLPTAGWNKKMVMVGGGGFDGYLAAPTDQTVSPSILTQRYATLTSNGGHAMPPTDPAYFKAEFAYNPVQLADYTYASEHRALPLGKEVVEAMYGVAPAKSFFEGCSMGGHDAMIASQRYPNDFDGIVAKAPAGNIMGLFMQFNRLAKQVRTEGASLSPAKRALLESAVAAQCDAVDGLTDGVISKPSACAYNALALRCTNGADTGDSCLSDAQIATVNAVTSPVATADGAWSHSGYNFGLEGNPKGWAEYIWPVASAPFNGNSLQGLFSDGFIRSFITRNPHFDTGQWQANDWLAQYSLIGAMFNASNPDLSGMQSRGAKMIMWNGTNDTSVSARDTARYYDQVVRKMGQVNADNVVELFLAPGVGHCTGGVGPDQVDLMQAVSDWVDKATPPSKQGLVHAKLDANGKTVLTRPLCKHPSYPRYKGAGDVNDAASFSCSTL